MAKFLGKLTVVEIDDSIFQVAVSPFNYQSDLLPGTISVPVGFYTDFGSVPRWLPMIYALIGNTCHDPAIVHDWLYYSAITDRKTSDQILIEALKVCGISAWRCWLFYAGVRAGGWASWNKHRKDNHSSADFPSPKLV